MAIGYSPNRCDIVTEGSGLVAVLAENKRKRVVEYTLKNITIMKGSNV